MSCRRPSNASSSEIGPSGPISVMVGSTSTMGSRLRAAAIASPSRVCAFSRTRSLSSSAWKMSRSTTVGRLAALVAPAAGPPRFVGSSLMSVSSLFVIVKGDASLCPVLRPRQGRPCLEQGLQTGEDGRPAVRDALENVATRLEAVVDDRELDHTVPGVLDVEGDLGAGFSPPGFSGGFVHADLGGPLGGERVLAA